MNSIQLAIERIVASDSARDLLTDDGRVMAFPVRLPKDTHCPSLVVNRLSEQMVEEERVAVLGVSCFAPSFLQAEELGNEVSDVLSTPSEFLSEHGVEILTEMGSSDITAFDETRELYLRQLEVMVRW